VEDIRILPIVLSHASGPIIKWCVTVPLGAGRLGAMLCDCHVIKITV